VGGRATERNHKRSSSFSEEKEAKRLLFLRQRQDAGHGLHRGRGGGIKVFWFFSSEKNILASL
jgi:hypothetical protein